jgi:diguanylate cyclase (GGDEF)-like protein/PAS domain S-box-containing protein
MEVNADNIKLKNSLIKAINEALSEGILVVNDKGIIVSHNSQFVELWKIPSELLSGFEPDTAIGINNAQILAKAAESVKDRKSFLARIQELYDNPDLNDHCEIELLDGRTLERHSTILRSDEGQNLGRVWFFRNITERKQAEIAFRRSEYHLREAQSISHVGSWEYDITTGQIYWSAELHQIFGIPPETFIPHFETFNNLIHPDDRAAMHASVAACIAGQKPEALEWRCIRPDGTTRCIVGGAELVLDAEGKAYRLCGTAQDITERKQIEEKLLITQFASDNAPDSIFWIDEQARIVYVNEAACRERGYTRDELLTMSIPDIDPNCLDDVWLAHWQELRQKGNLISEVRHRHKDGSIFPVEVSANFVEFEGKEINISFSRNITGRKQAEEEIQLLAFYDPLTHLPNRRLLMDRLQHTMASSMRSSRKSALLFIDLDHFKTINDTLGHNIGDLLLQQVAQRLESCLRQGDTVARLGGDEFVVMLEDLSENDLEAAAQTEDIGDKILATLNQPYQLNQHESRSTPSIGATLFGGHDQAIEELLKQADIAMYQAKKAGRNTLRFFDPKMQDTLNVRATLEHELHVALEKQQFQLYYQIQVDGVQADGSHHILGAEALIRWIHPKRGLVPPFEFIPVAEETGAILPIGQWVLESACAQLKAWEKDEHTCNLEMAVNISAKQFRQPDFVCQIKAVVQNHAINPKLLKLELTESLLLDDIEDTIATMDALTEIGVRFSLDDFGTGYSSLQYLKRLPLHQLKIDKSFVRDIATGSNDKAIVSTIIAMAKSLNMDVIAEGVETKEQLKLLMKNGCTHYQGYLFGKPVPIDEYEASLRMPSALGDY